ncbi:hypothetical protein EDM54_13315 [Brevibacillus borstelensis]|uniref:Uncharacterized protein n=1 Tax=Brevibacillus borstelensis AK1 TaxID=1300222 RepID=M8DK78_9BACL|nr:hypothetical protein [Brevibacillus borstelensis]EMT54003.1 hypothetical protein I532_00315 [Brevibacillus borstelensis AK1]MED1885161.1 hypothetical protein [Brevibacillus borstelensis]RNB62685.1 hypothetical protein EDM54_13315 [Brevibacillus borstelensis]GED53599.1 hypothetical protein BBO01nite_28400 [Brevibacillus borstelensis]
MKKVVFSLLSVALASSVAVVASASESTTNAVIKPQAIFLDREPNNKRADANLFVIADGSQISGSLGRDDAADWFKFTPLTSGKYRFIFSHSSSQYYELTLRGDGVGTVATITYDNPNKYFDVTVDAGRDYYIAVESVLTNLNADTSYDIYTVKID